MIIVVSNVLKNANQRKMEQNFNEFCIYMDQKVLTEKHVKGKQKDLQKNVIDAFTWTKKY